MDIMQAPLCAKDFESALGTAFALEQEYNRAHFAVLLDKNRQVRDIAIYDRQSDSYLDALHYAVARARVGSKTAQVIIISVIDTNPDDLLQSDIEIFLWGEKALSEVGAELLDWIKVHDGLYRSFAQTVAPNRAW